MKPSKPSFQSVVDLGLRDVGVKTELSRLGVQSARFAIRLLAPVAFSIYALCVLAATTKADPAVLLSFSLVWMGGLFVLTLRLGKRAPVFVVRVNAGGTNQVSWLIIGMSLLFVPVAVLAWDPLLIAPSVLMLIMSLLVWRGRGRVPEVLRRLRALLATDESVLGDGIGVAQGGRRWQDAFRLLVATDRRLLVATAARSAERLLLIDAPYRDISRFGIEWKHWGR